MSSYSRQPYSIDKWQKLLTTPIPKKIPYCIIIWTVNVVFYLWIFRFPLNGVFQVVVVLCVCVCVKPIIIVIIYYNILYEINTTHISVFWPFSSEFALQIWPFVECQIGCRMSPHSCRSSFRDMR